MERNICRWHHSCVNSPHSACVPCASSPEAFEKHEKSRDIWVLTRKHLSCLTVEITQSKCFPTRLSHTHLFLTSAEWHQRYDVCEFYLNSGWPQVQHAMKYPCCLVSQKENTRFLASVKQFDDTCKRTREGWNISIGYFAMQNIVNIHYSVFVKIEIYSIMQHRDITD